MNYDKFHQLHLILISNFLYMLLNLISFNIIELRHSIYCLQVDSNIYILIYIISTNLHPDNDIFLTCKHNVKLIIRRLNVESIEHILFKQDH